MNAGSRRGAFDPNRLIADVDELLPPVSFTEPAPGATPRPAHPQSPSRPARGGAGRPAGSTSGVPAPAQVPARVPKPLYDAVNDLLVGQLVRPSYGQLASWTCEDHFEEVVEELRASMARSHREPRGRRAAVENVSVTLRFLGPELVSLQRVIDAVEAEKPPTRTAAVTAAFRVLVKHGYRSDV